MLDRIRCALLACAIGLGLCGSVSAQTLPMPEGEVVLTVRGDLALHTSGGEALLDLAMFESIGMQTVTTSTIWTDGVIAFEGVELARLVEHLGAKGSVLRLTALNDYAVDIPMSEVVAGGPLLALRMDGVNLSPRDKGPVWMVYPYDSKPQYKTEVSYSRSIWQLATIEVLP